MSRIEQANRVLRLLDRLSGGERSVDILDDLKHQKETGERNNKRGLESEERVRNALAAIPGVKVIKPRSRKIDRKGVDLIADLPDGRRVHIQVKSCWQKIAQFKSEFAQKRDIPFEKIDDYMRNHWWFIVNGQQSIEEIRNEFIAFCQKP